MKAPLVLFVTACSVLTASIIAGAQQPAAPEPAEDRAIAAAMASLDAYMAVFNARDAKGWAATLNYPHVRIAGGDVRVWETEEAFAADMDFDAFAQRYGWDHSHWDARDVIQHTADKVHVAVQFTRYNAENKPIATYESLYIVTLKDGRWGTQARSSFAP